MRLFVNFLVYIHTYAIAPFVTNAHTYMHTHKHAHTHAHTHTRTHTHTASPQGMAENAHPLAVPLGEDAYDWQLIDLPKDYYRSISKLACHVKAVIADNERYHERTCEKFYIGKSHVHTWNSQHITRSTSEAVHGRWRDHQKKGFNNLAVLTVVTRDSLPPLQSRNPATWKQQYTIALEQALITHFMFVEDDRRHENENTEPGNLERGGAVGYVVYLAMRFSDPTPPAATATHTPPAATAAYTQPGPPTRTVKVEDDWKIPTANTDKIATTVPTISHAESQPAPVLTRQETPPPKDTPKSRAPSTCRTLFPPSPPTGTVPQAPPTPGVTPHEYPVVPSRGDGVIPCKCGSTEHKTIGHHTCPLRKPCKCGSTTHQKISHKSCPLNFRNLILASAVPQGSE